MNSLAKYWTSLTKFRRGFLVIGIIVTSPVLAVLAVVAGIAEVWKLIQNLEV